MVLMHGVQNFPTRIEDAHMHRIKILASLFPFPVGYQDHTDASDPFSRIIDLIAIGAGARVIEKHISLDRSEKGTDYQSALEPSEFGNFVTMIRTAETAMGANRIHPLSPSEKEYRMFQKKGIVALETIQPEEPIALKKLAFLRCGVNPDLAPKDIDHVLGKKAKRQIDPFEPITRADIQ